MGCVCVKPNEKKFGNEVMIQNQSTAPVLSEKEKLLLEDSWHHLKEDISKVGVITFIGLFETHPEVQETFLPFRQLSKIDMEKSEILKSHALRVMGTVDKCMARVEKPDKFQDLMLDLGGRHRNYNAKYEYIEMVGPQFVHAIKPHLNDTWSDEMEDAWLKLFKLMSYYMKNGLTENGVSSSHRTEKNRL